MTCDPWPSRCLNCHTGLMDDVDFCAETGCEQTYAARLVNRRMTRLLIRAHLRHLIRRALRRT